jgi:predicted ester cyclase
MADTAKQIAYAFYNSYNNRNLDASFDAYISTELVNHFGDGSYNRQSWLEIDKTLFPAFKDFSVTVLDQVAEGDKVATRYRSGSTQTGEFLGIPASGNTAYMTVTSVDRIENGKIVEHWADLDFNGFLQQLTAPAGDGQ